MFRSAVGTGTLRPSRQPLRGFLRMRFYLHAIEELRHPERLSWVSSGLPWFAVSQDGVEDDDELTDAGGERLFSGFAGGSEFFVVSGDYGIGAAGDQGGHEESGAHAGAPAGDGAASAQGAAVAVDRGDTDQSGDFAAIESAELGQLGDQGPQGCGA